MKRLAIILYSPLTRARGNKYSPQLKKNAEFQLDFLKSASGGAWRDEEIICIENPTRSQIANVRSLCERMDCVILFFSGHGGSQSGRGFIQINDSERIWVDSLFTSAKRQISIIEACRGEIATYNHDTGRIAGTGFTFDYKNLDLARKLYELYMEQIPYGHIVIYSSLYNQLSMMTEKGGDYNCALMKGVVKWSSSNQSEVLSVKNALSKSIVQLNSDTQSPTLDYTCDAMHNAPFAINPTAYLLRNGYTPKPKSQSKVTQPSIGKTIVALGVIAVSVGVMAAVLSNDE